MIYITGDTHRRFQRVRDFIKNNNTTKDDMLIIAGDVGINYFLSSSDVELKKELEALPITFFCVRGNHEERPENIGGYVLTEIDSENFSGKVYVQKEFPSLLFAVDGPCRIGNYDCLIINGAFSVDMQWRLANGQPWFPDEELSREEMMTLIKQMDALGNKIDMIISHTCPKDYLPSEMFLPGLDRTNISTKMEGFMDEIHDKVDYKKWYCGHWHTDKTVDKIRFIFNSFVEFGEDL